MHFRNTKTRCFTCSWEQRKLGDVAEHFEYGLNAAATEFDGVNKYLRITDIDDDTHEFRFDDLTTPQANLETCSNYLLEKGDLLFARTGASVGKTYLYRPFDGKVYFAGFLIRARVGNEADSEFVFQSTLTERYRRYISITSQRSGQPGVNAQEYAELEIPLPSLPEQREIGSLLHGVDNLITLHQRKHDRLVVLKKALLGRMFPRDGSRFPELRFDGFTDPWEQRKFSEVFSFLRNNTLSRAELSDSEGETRDVHYGDILIKFGEVIDVRRDELPRIASDALAGRLSCQPLSNGDVIIADTAEDEAVGKCSELRGCSDYPIVSGLHTMACRPEFEFAPGYLGYYMNSPAFHDQLLPLMQGIKVISVSKGAISDTDVRFPSLPEQKAIGASLTELDNLITLHQRKLELLRNLKSACLDKMFV